LDVTYDTSAENYYMQSASAWSGYNVGKVVSGGQVQVSTFPATLTDTTGNMWYQHINLQISLCSDGMDVQCCAGGMNYTSLAESLVAYASVYQWTGKTKTAVQNAWAGTTSVPGAPGATYSSYYLSCDCSSPVAASTVAAPAPPTLSPTTAAAAAGGAGTAYALCSSSTSTPTCFTALPKSPYGKQSKWGWVNQVKILPMSCTLWLGAAQCDTAKGTNVGSLSVSSTSLTASMSGSNTASSMAYFANSTYMLPYGSNGWTTAPGQYPLQITPAGKTTTVTIPKVNVGDYVIFHMTSP